MEQGQARLANFMGIHTEGMSSTQAAEAAIQAVSDFFNSVGVATRLRDLQIPQADLKALAEDDAAQPAYGQTSGRLTDINQLLEILRASW